MSSVIEVTQGIAFAFKVFDMLPLYGVLFDRDGTVITANRTFLDTIGLQQEEITGMSAEELTYYYIDLKKNLVDLLPHTVRTFRSSLLRNDGTRFPVEHTLAHVVEGEQEVIVSISHKVEGRTLAQERREAEKKIQAAKKRKRQFIANINHEIRTPMNAIVGYAEMLAESDIDEYQRRYVEIIKRNSAHLVAVVNDIMELSKLETGRVRLLKSPVNLHVLIEQLHELFVDQAVGKHLEFTCEVHPELPAYYVLDADHCRRILTALLGNAVKYTDAGWVILSVSGEQKTASQYSLTFRITDTGKGMSAQEQKRVLDLMSPKKDAVTIHNGKCLGLTLSARLARLMDGDIRFESIEGKGSTFSFIMPASAADEQAVHHIGPVRPQRS
ncbi:MAG: PAS domain S-box protein, partial [Candidatus Electrothrix sp. EH2]|nr:PAS domain S-box protein [Candidatus Electrothrix sp. EH2]